MKANHDDTPSLATRRQEWLILLRAAVQRTAQQILLATRYQRGTVPNDREFLQDAARGRRAPSAETIASLIALQDAPRLSEEIRSVELTNAPAPCLSEATLKETAANGPLDEAQLLLEREGPTKARIEQAMDAARRQLAATRQFLDALTLKKRSVA